MQSTMWVTMCYHRVGCAGPPEHLSPPQSPFSFSLPGVNALIFVGLDRVANFDRVMQLEFGRGFTYNRPLRVNLLDLDFELAEQLVSNLAQAVLPCNAGGKPMAGSAGGLSRGWITLSWLCSSPLPATSQLFSQMPQQIKFRADHSLFPLLKKPYTSQDFRSNVMG